METNAFGTALNTGLLPTGQVQALGLPVGPKKEKAVRKKKAKDSDDSSDDDGGDSTGEDSEAIDSDEEPYISSSGSDEDSSESESDDDGSDEDDKSQKDSDDDSDDYELNDDGTYTLRTPGPKAVPVMSPGTVPTPLAIPLGLPTFPVGPPVFPVGLSGSLPLPNAGLLKPIVPINIVAGHQAQPTKPKATRGRGKTTVPVVPPMGGFAPLNQAAGYVRPSIETSIGLSTTEYLPFLKEEALQRFLTGSSVLDDFLSRDPTENDDVYKIRSDLARLIHTKIKEMALPTVVLVSSMIIKKTLYGVKYKAETDVELAKITDRLK